jgi:hypothetical protein
MYTYAFFTDPEQVSDLPMGIAGPLATVIHHEVAALVEPDLAFEQYEENDERLMQAVLAHDRAIRELFRQVPLLPLRFGTRFKSQDALIMHLHQHESEYLTKLRHLTGRAEYTLKFLPIELPAPEVPADTKGKDYFMAKKRLYQQQQAQQQQQEQELEQLREAIAQTYPDMVEGSSQDAIERLYLLLPRQAEAELLDHVQIWQQDYPQWDIELSEALPPYHFV